MLIIIHCIIFMAPETNTGGRMLRSGRSGLRRSQRNKKAPSTRRISRYHTKRLYKRQDEALSATKNKSKKKHVTEKSSINIRNESSAGVESWARRIVSPLSNLALSVEPFGWPPLFLEADLDPASDCSSTLVLSAELAFSSLLLSLSYNLKAQLTV